MRLSSNRDLVNMVITEKLTQDSKFLDEMKGLHENKIK